MSIKRPNCINQKGASNYRKTCFENTNSNHGWYYCGYCGKPLQKKSADVDHMISQALGGSNDASNLTVSCPHCNRQKGSKDPEGYEIWKMVTEDEEDEKLFRMSERNKY